MKLNLKKTLIISTAVGVGGLGFWLLIFEKEQSEIKSAHHGRNGSFESMSGGDVDRSKSFKRSRPKIQKAKKDIKYYMAISKNINHNEFEEVINSAASDLDYDEFRHFMFIFWENNVGVMTSDEITNLIKLSPSGDKVSVMFISFGSVVTNHFNSSELKKSMDVCMSLPNGSARAYLFGSHYEALALNVSSINELTQIVDGLSELTDLDQSPARTGIVNGLRRAIRKQPELLNELREWQTDDRVKNLVLSGAE